MSDIYEGHFVNSKKNGTGVQTSSTGDVYTGHFKDDKIEGGKILCYSVFSF